LSNAFTDYKGVMKSWNPMINASERVEVSKKITLAPSATKRGRIATTKKDNALNKHPINERTRALRKTVNVSQPVGERHHVDVDDP
jgi:hypothetical protein